MAPFEREHLEAAVHFLRARELATGAIPEPAEFEAWVKALDSRGRYHFDRGGYSLDKRCGSRFSDF